MVTRTYTRESKKVTFSLPASLVDEVQELVRSGEAPSQSAFVTEALEKEIRARRIARLKQEFRQAAADPDFLRDLDQVMSDFAAADGETARLIP